MCVYIYIPMYIHMMYNYVYVHISYIYISYVYYRRKSTCICIQYTHVHIQYLLVPISSESHLAGAPGWSCKSCPKHVGNSMSYPVNEHSYGKWPNMTVHLLRMVIFHSYVNVDQRVNLADLWMIVTIFCGCGSFCSQCPASPKSSSRTLDSLDLSWKILPESVMINIYIYIYFTIPRLDCWTIFREIQHLYPTNTSNKCTYSKMPGDQ